MSITRGQNVNLKKCIGEGIRHVLIVEICKLAGLEVKLAVLKSYLAGLIPKFPEIITKFPEFPLWIPRKV